MLSLFKDRSSFVSKINEIRRNHKVNPVVEDKALNTAAQKWAEEIAKKDKAENGPEDDQGECLFSYRFILYQIIME